MSVQQEHATSETATLTTTESGGVYQSLFDKINLTPVSSIQEIDLWQNSETLADASPDERVTAAIHVLLSCLAKSGENVVKLDKSLLDFHIDDLDQKISKQLDAVMHHPEFQKVESLWRGTWFVVQRTDFRKNVRIELLDISKEHLRQDFDDSPEIIQSGLYRHTYIQEYDTPGGEPVASLISSYEFDNSPQDIALLRNISRVSAASHMPFIGSVGPKFFLKNSMEEVAAIKDIGNYFDRAEYIKWKSFRDTDDSRYVGLVMPRVLGRLPYGPDTVPVRSFNYVEEVKGPDHEKYLWTNASFAFAANMVKSFVNNGWCVQIRGPQAGGAVADLPIHLYDLGTGNQVKIPSEVMIPETREFEFSNLGFIPLSYYKNRDYACFFSANSAQKPALYDTADATANSRINARLPYIFLLSRIAHYLKIIQRENIGTTKDRRVLELELNTWIRTLVTDRLAPDIARINFYRFCQLLEQSQQNAPLGSTDNPATDAVRFRPHPGMGFPVSELKNVERDAGNPDVPPTVRTTFLGLYGVDSPLPTAYLDYITQRHDGHDAVMAFLDIFNHRFITQYYRIWRKYNYPASFEAGAMDDISRCLLGLIGLGIPGSENHIATPVSRFLALLSVMRLPTRTAEGVTALVGLLAPLTKATVVPHDPQPVILPAPAGLSKNSRISLKTRTLLGRTGTDVNSQLLLKLYTEDAAEARGWLPGGQLHSDLLVLLRVYLGWRCQARLQLTLPVSLLPAARLGKQRVQISRTGILRASFAAPATGTVTVSLGRYQGLIPALSIRNRESMTHVSYSF